MICNNFKYPKLLEFFEKISAIPRASYEEEKIVAYLLDFAKERGLEAYTDESRNVLINMPASKGCEDRPAILLQGHTDMVCECNIGCEHDFSTDPLDLFLDGDLVGARGTTLGADDGVAVAIMLAILDGACAQHGPIQCLFTASEEVGLDGARGFDYGKIFAKRMINMDGAEQDRLVVGCAGGVRSDAIFDIEYKNRTRENIVRITLGGLMGGHSGENINEGRANANKLAAPLLRALSEFVGAELVSFDGGSKDNAIPREAVLLIATDDVMGAQMIARKYAEGVGATLCPEDADFFIRLEELGAEGYDRVFSDEFTQKILDFSGSIDNGVLAMSEKIEGLVEFSRNLGIVKTEDGKIGFYFSSRSAIDAQLESSMAEIEGAAGLIGGKTTHHSRYPGWDVSGYSQLAEDYIALADKLFGTKVIKTALHAGLECGIVKQAIPDIEIISVGADIADLHSPCERLGLESLGRVFEIVKTMIEK